MALARWLSEVRAVHAASSNLRRERAALALPSTRGSGTSPSTLWLPSIRDGFAQNIQVGPFYRKGPLRFAVICGDARSRSASGTYLCAKPLSRCEQTITIASAARIASKKSGRAALGSRSAANPSYRLTRFVNFGDRNNCDLKLKHCPIVDFLDCDSVGR